MQKKLHKSTLKQQKQPDVNGGGLPGLGRHWQPHSSAMHRWEKYDLNLRALVLECTSLLLSGYGINVTITISSESSVTYYWFSPTWYTPSKCLLLANPILLKYQRWLQCLIVFRAQTPFRWQMHRLLKWHRGRRQIKGLLLDGQYLISWQHLHLYSWERFFNRCL